MVSGNYSRIYLFSLAISLLSLSLSAQRKSDIGIFAGTSWYMGDINPSRYFYLPALAIGPVYRYNFELRNSVRVSAIYHSLAGNDRDFTDLYQNMRDARFDANFIDMAAVYEFNFMPYKTADKKYNRTLYLSCGLGYNLLLSSTAPSNSQVILPFGIGYKFNAGKKLSAGAELSIRKSFSDLIDGVENFGLRGEKHLFGNNDWYTFAGIFVTYKIFNYREDCPAYN